MLKPDLAAAGHETKYRKDDDAASDLAFPAMGFHIQTRQRGFFFSF